MQRHEFIREGLTAAQQALNKTCNDSDGIHFCACQAYNNKNCLFYGQKVESLEFSLEKAVIYDQLQSPFFAKLPAEIRNKVYAYALTEKNSSPLKKCNIYRRAAPTDEPRSSPQISLPLALLQTCKKVYLEAYKLPFMINPFTIYHLGERFTFENIVCTPQLPRLAPWQFALMSKVDISLSQLELESFREESFLVVFLQNWRAAERIHGAVIAPRYYQNHLNRATFNLIASYSILDGVPVGTTQTDRYTPGNVKKCFAFGLLPKAGHSDGDQIPLATHSLRYPHLSHLFPQRPVARRAMAARPLTHLTLRLSRSDWVPLADNAQNQKLALDPGLLATPFTIDRTAERMVQFAAVRRKGKWPRYRDPYGQEENLDGSERRYHMYTWGDVICRVRSLQVLEFVWETFASREKQLDVVVDCAKTWRFPLWGTDSELVWDGAVEEGMRKEDVFVVVRIVRFVREKVKAD